MVSYERGTLLQSFSVIIPWAGPAVSTLLVARRMRDFWNSLPYLLYITPLSFASTVLFTFEYMKHFLLIATIYSLVSPLLFAYAFSKKFDSMEINVNEYYIEVKLKVPLLSDQVIDPNSLFERVVSKAIRRVRNPYYNFKLKSLNNCSNLKVSLSENKITMRRRCGDIIVEVIISNNDTADMKLSISY
ncbi:hypothetical protein L3N51_00902 [Metallosphaera sp. J1]|uniref:hypothetical protein n=1 Tax=Metallosphaera TaxID=41980 RepID=UPI001EE0EAF1|nr:hypothetical protein [Metallosphaera javensis (ex Hofmann et al. 2022)]MCG3108618.1 hypothetical protein [Metallosphaera javensis (ex Hofmann et al. 2022)]BCS91693.1 MAG: hypothetical protein MjAS7_0301 [Metallosphaera javensis (ex Sakai et al. 2022)]